MVSCDSTPALAFMIFSMSTIVSRCCLWVSLSRCSTWASTCSSRLAVLWCALRARSTTVFVWKNEHSIATIIWALYTNQEYFLCAVLFVFSILFPFLKLFYLLTLLTSPDLPADFRKKSIATMEWLGRYSMTDVMVLALMIFYVNSSGYTDARVLPGAYYFAASALITMLAYGWAHTVPGAPQAAPRPVEIKDTPRQIA
jgi:paraquat-inducible protein A